MKPCNNSQKKETDFMSKSVSFLLVEVVRNPPLVRKYKMAIEAISCTTELLARIINRPKSLCLRPFHSYLQTRNCQSEDLQKPLCLKVAIMVLLGPASPSIFATFLAPRFSLHWLVISRNPPLDFVPFRAVGDGYRLLHSSKSIL